MTTYLALIARGIRAWFAVLVRSHVVLRTVPPASVMDSSGDTRQSVGPASYAAATELAAAAGMHAEAARWLCAVRGAGLCSRAGHRADDGAERMLMAAMTARYIIATPAPTASAQRVPPLPPPPL